MKLHHASLIALGIATPLWVRQYRVEQRLITRQRQVEKELGEFAVELNESWVSYTKGLNKSLKKAFS